MTNQPDGPTNATRADGTRYYRGGCAKGMPLYGACHRNCLHRALVTDYQDARRVWEDGFETSTGTSYRPGIIADRRRAERRGGRNEVGDYVEATPPPTFRAWLEGHAHRNRQD